MGARQNFFFGAKLVRGAYMEQERARAEQLGYEDPINPDFEATSASYHRCLAECMRRMHGLKTENMPQKVGIMVASHNADTIRFALTRMKDSFASDNFTECATTCHSHLGKLATQSTNMFLTDLSMKFFPICQGEQEKMVE